MKTILALVLSVSSVASAKIALVCKGDVEHQQSRQKAIVEVAVGYRGDHLFNVRVVSQQFAFDRTYVMQRNTDSAQVATFKLPGVTNGPEFYLDQNPSPARGWFRIAELPTRGTIPCASPLY
jgi:hypothetical protein